MVGLTGEIKLVPKQIRKNSAIRPLTLNPKTAPGALLLFSLSCTLLSTVLSGISRRVSLKKRNMFSVDLPWLIKGLKEVT